MSQRLEALSNPETTTLVLVSRAERTALREAERTSRELGELGIRNQRIVFNGLFTASETSDPVAVALESRGRAALAELPAGLAPLPRVEVPLLPFGLIGIPALRALNNPALVNLHPSMADAQEEFGSLPPSLESLIPEMAHVGHGVILTMGKGGVGKTTIATKVALTLAKLGHKVHLSTTDPAAHLDLTLGERVSNLTVSRIDPAVETEDYTEEVMAHRGPRSRCAGESPPRRGSAFAVHRRDRGLSGLRPYHRSRQGWLRRARHRSHRAHVASARCDRGLSPRCLAKLE